MNDIKKEAALIAEEVIHKATVAAKEIIATAAKEAAELIKEAVEVDKITDAVNQGIVASKEADSNFWGEQKLFNEKAVRHFYEHDTYAKQTAKDMSEVLERVTIQNGRTRKLEDEQIRMKPVAKIVYGIVTMLGIATLGAIFKLILK